MVSIEGKIGSRLTRSDIEVELNGDASETKFVGAFFGHDDQHFDVNARVWHNGEHTTADRVTRSVLDDRARSVYEGVQKWVMTRGTRTRTSARTR